MEWHTFVRTLLQLPIVRCLLEKVKKALSKSFIGDGPSYIKRKKMNVSTGRLSLSAQFCYLPADCSDMVVRKRGIEDVSNTRS